MAPLDRLARWWRSLGSSAAPRSANEESNAPSPDDDPDSEEGQTDEPVQMPIEEAIDLHHFAPRDIPSVVAEYLREAQLAGFQEVRVIHGKGKGVQRRRVQLLLKEHPAVLSFRSDGLGSTLVALRRT